MVVQLPASDDLAGMEAVGRAVADAITAMREALEPGVSTAELDAIGAGSLRRSGALSAPATCYAFPAATCISVNDEAAHGIPGPRRIASGDLVNFDVSASLDGYFADAGASYPVGDVTDEASRLCAAGREALREALAVARPGKLLNGVGRAVERVARRRRMHVIRNLCGHGVGRELHEYPRAVLNYYDARDRRRFVAGMVLTIEPFLSLSAEQAIEAGDGWTLKTADGSLAVQHERTFVVTRGGPHVLTPLDDD